MFKIPDWGSDIPKADVEVVKLFTKQGKKNTNKNKNHTDINDSLARNKRKNEKNNNRKNINNGIQKAKNKMNGHAKLSKDDHIKNRILQRSLRNNTTELKNNSKFKEMNTDTPKADKLLNGYDVNNMMKNKLLKRKGKISKLPSNIKSNEEEIIVNSNSKHSKKKFKDNYPDKKPQALDSKQVQINKKPNDVDISDIEDIHNFKSDEPDHILVNAKGKKLNDEIKNEDVKDVLFGSNYNNQREDIANSKKGRVLQKKKEKLKEILKTESNRNVIKSSGNNLRERMLQRLKAAQFRYINEKLYTASGSESQELFKSDPVAFQTYHEGFQQQVKKWPINPLDLIVKRIQKMPKTHVIADMGCGEAALSRRVAQSVRSFDLVASAPGVEACDMAHTPLLASSVDAVVFCLALMGTDLTQYLLEANRVLKIGGHLLIAEVESRFNSVESFRDVLQRLGFELKREDRSHQLFVFLEFAKAREAPVKRNKLPTLTLKPCLYKKR